MGRGVSGETLLVAAAPEQSISEPAVLETSAGPPAEVRAFPDGAAEPVMVMPVRGSLVEIFGQDVGGDVRIVGAADDRLFAGIEKRKQSRVAAAEIGTGGALQDFARTRSLKRQCS